MKMRLLLLLLLIAATALCACEGLAGEPRIVATVAPSNSVDAASNPEIAAVMTLGGEVWSANCERCHGRMGGGTAEGAPLPSLADLSDDQILAAITNGIAADANAAGIEMPAFGNTLSAEELNAAMTYAKMMSRAIQQGMVQSDSADAAASAADVPPPSIGAVVGSASNGTTNGTIPEALPLTLHIITADAEDITFETVADASGSFRFENVPLDATYQYAITAPYGDIQFISDIVSADPTLPELSLPITLYETGADSTSIVIDAISEQISVTNNVLQVIQIVSFLNTSDRVYYTPDVDGQNGTSVAVNLPEGASLSGTVNANYRLSADSKQVIETRPVLPGQSRIMHVTYQMPYSSGMSLAQPLDYALNGRVEVILANAGLTLNSDVLPSLGTITFNGINMGSYGEILQQTAGSSLNFSVNGEAGASGAATSTAVVAEPNPIAYILIIAGVAALLLAAGLTLRERISQNRKGLST